MSRAAGIEPGLYGAEFEVTAGPGQELAEPGEVCIAGGIAASAGIIEIVPFPVRVPKLYQRVLDRISAAVEDPPTDVGDDAARNRQVIVELNKVIVLVERDVVSQRVVRSLRDDGRL